MLTNYSLIDSGNNLKLERFAERTLVRPSRFCIWTPRADPQTWDKADAIYDPDKGWSFRGPRFEQWEVKEQGMTFILRLQSNGQVGIFPEHSQYFPKLADSIKKCSRVEGEKPKVLNLFAYTGLASLICLKAGAQVTHVDIARKVLDWARQNLEANGLEQAGCRLIEEDSISFLDREIKRGNFYDLVIADPPSFSRLSSKKTWDIEEIMPSLLEKSLSVLKPEGGSLFFTSHHYEMGGWVMANLLRDALAQSNLKMKAQQILPSDMTIPEANSGRVLPAGFLVVLEN